MPRRRQNRLPAIVVALAAVAAATAPTAPRADALGDACPAPGSCTEPHGTPGCADEACCTAVCDVDPVCCSAAWDGLCVEFASQLCTTFPGCGSADAASCFAPSGPRCDDLACCETVCAADAACCEVAWDLGCVDLADALCAIAPPPNDECEGATPLTLGTTPITLAGCLPSDDLAPPCADPFGPDAWFLFTAPCTGPAVARTCASTAIVDTRIAVYTASCEAPVLLGCNDDAESCGAGTSVVLFEATLGETYLVRVGSADRRADLVLTLECGASCPFETPPDATFEIEACGESSNRGCTSSGPEFEPIAIGDRLVGTVRAESGVRDTDWFTFEVTDPGTIVEARLTSLFDGSVYLLEGSCPPEIITTYEVGCPAVARACLFPGTYSIFVAPNDFVGLPCDTPESRYLLELVRVEEVCEELGCGGSRTSTCFLTSEDPFCNDAECCEQVCKLDPSCCELEWDGACVEAAIALCLPPIPNDDCGGALPLPFGTTPFSTIGATTDDPQLPAFCDEGTGAYLRNDLWFAWTAPSDGTLVLSTCGQADFDTRIALVGDGCDGEVVACNNNAVGCAGFTSELVAPVTCGRDYRVRLGSAGLLIGEGLLTVAFLPDDGAPPCDECATACRADLDRDGLVAGGDLSGLLAAWGTAPAPDDPARCADLDDDGAIDGADLAILLSAWGACP